MVLTLPFEIGHDIVATVQVDMVHLWEFVWVGDKVDGDKPVAFVDRCFPFFAKGIMTVAISVDARKKDTGCKAPETTTPVSY